MALAVSPCFSHLAPDRNASMADSGAAEANASFGCVVPSKAPAGAARRPTPITRALRRGLAVRIALLLGGPARMGHSAVHGGADLLGVLPQIAGRGRRIVTRLPGSLAPG